MLMLKITRTDDSIDMSRANIRYQGKIGRIFIDKEEMLNGHRIAVYPQDTSKKGLLTNKTPRASMCLFHV